MLSSLASLADRNFIIGFLLPALLAVLACLFTFQDFAPIGATWTAVLEAEKFATLTLLLISVWVLAVLLSVFNIGFYRVLEGYVGPMATKRMRSRAIARRRDRQGALKALRTVAAKEGHGSAAWSKYVAAHRNFLSDYPTLDDAGSTECEVESLVVPTRFGNIVRSFETYPLKIYGVDGIPSWLRMAAVIPVDFQAIVAAARAEVDAFVNTFFLALAVALLALVSAFPVLEHCMFDSCGWDWHHQNDPILWRRIGVFIGGIVIAYFAYESAINRARPWGDIVRSAFDLYLSDLAKKLGFEEPKNLSRRRAFWGAVNGMFLDGLPLDPEQWSVSLVTADSATSAGQTLPH